jgi:hypothetical protein
MNAKARIRVIWTLRWNSRGTSKRKSSMRWTAEKAENATAETIAEECHLERLTLGPSRPPE